MFHFFFSEENVVQIFFFLKEYILITKVGPKMRIFLSKKAIF